MNTVAAIKIVPAGMEDVDAIRDLTRAAYAKWVDVIGREPKPMLADYAHAVAHHRVDLLSVGGALAGLIELIPHDDYLLIENVAVLPAFQKQGLGRRLLDHAEWVAGSLNLGEMRLYTNSMFVENIALYLRCGYERDREESYLSGTIVHMRKFLPQG